MKRMMPAKRRVALTTLLLCPALIPSVVRAQQFNSDSYLTMPHGVVTIVGSVGEKYSTLWNTFALLPNWEFNVGGTVFRENPRTDTSSYFSANVYLKHMLHENAARTGGWAIAGGTGISPDYLEAGTVTRSFRSYWANAQFTLPFFDNTLSWDIVPGFNVNLDQGARQETAWATTYSTRLAVYKVIPDSAIVGEVFGAWGEGGSDPQYRIGVRWEGSKSVVVAATYSADFDGSRGPGFEIGAMIFTPPFLKIDKRTNQ